MVTIDKRLNLIVPIIRGDATKLYVHSAPIMRETFEQYHLVLAKTFSAFAQNGLDPRSGPSVAAMILKDVAQATSRGIGPDGPVSWWDGPDGVGGEGGLIAEIVRLSNAIVTTAQAGWTTMPLRTALDQNLMDEDEKSEVMNLLVFFTVASLVAPRLDRGRLVRGMAAIYELQTSSSNCTEFANSLRTSTAVGTTGASAAP